MMIEFTWARAVKRWPSYREGRDGLHRITERTRVRQLAEQKLNSSTDAWYIKKIANSCKIVH